MDSSQPRQAPQKEDMPYVLDRAGICGSRQSFVDASRLLVLLCKQLRDDAEDEADNELEMDAELKPDDDISWDRKRVQLTQSTL